MLKIPVFRDFPLSSVLFHEIGHQIHATARPEFREKEDVADAWKEKLQRRYFRSRYPWMSIVARLLRPLTRRYFKKRESV